MKWQRVTIVSRLFCLFMGIGGLLLGWLLLSNIDVLKSQPADTLVYLVIAAFGIIPFLFAGIVGKFPDISSLTTKDDGK